MPEPTTHTDNLLQLAQQGPVRARDLNNLGIPRAYLQRLCEQGVLERVGRGLYRMVDQPVSELHSLAQVGKRVPHGIICLLSALQLYGLTTEAPGAVWLLIETHAHTPRITSPRLEIVRASGAALEFGVDLRTIEGVPVRVTSAAKTVADCFRFRRHVGLEVALAALRDYLRTEAAKAELDKPPIDALVEAARADRVWSVMRPYVEALA